jgi:hypothetical protein
MSEREEYQPIRITWLSEADAARLDARLENGAVGESGGADTSAQGDARDRKIGQWLALIREYPTEPADPGLVDSTLKRIREDENRRRFAHQLNMLTAGGGPAPGPSWRQMATVAAVVVVAVSLLLPVLSHNRDLARQLACQGRLGEAAKALAGYAADHDGAMPRGKVTPGSPWSHVGHPAGEDGSVQSNSAHLYILIREGYAQPRDLTCPSNPHARPEQLQPSDHDWPTAQAVSFSYQNQYTPKPIELQRHPNLAVLADKNPLFVARAGQVTHDPARPARSPSRMHDSRGQNVLTADGEVKWTLQPMMGQDNIWVARGVKHYHGNEQPSGADDSFLVP